MLSCVGAQSPPDPRLASFERDVRPILKAACFQCHGENDEREGGLDVRLARLLKAGGDSGPAIEPGAAEESLLWERVRDGEMPPDPKHRLSPAQIDLIRQWISAGRAPTNPNRNRLRGC